MTCILLVPGDADDLDRTISTGASVVVVDPGLGAASRAACRERLFDWLHRTRALKTRPALYLRVSEPIEADLDAFFSAGLDGLMLAACRSAEDVQRLGAKLAVREAEHGMADGCTGILAGVATSAAGVLALPSVVRSGSRLRGLVWQPGALAESLGLERPAALEDESAPLVHARAMVIVAAKAAGVPAYEDPFGGFGDDLARVCSRGRRDGFSGAVTRDSRLAGPITAAYRTRG